MTTPYRGPLTITLSRHIDATPEEVYAAWTDAEGYRRWFEAHRLLLNPVVDGQWYVESLWEGRIWPHYGRFLRLERPRLVEHTWVSEATKGIESVLTITLTPSGGGTDLKLTHAGLPDDELGRQHEAGWKEILAAFAEKIARRAR
jgi:uncharacterized protein YndB with AHSA1/START domain